MLLSERKMVTTRFDPTSLAPTPTPAPHLWDWREYRVGEGVYALKDRAAGCTEWQRGRQGRGGKGVAVVKLGQGGYHRAFVLLGALLCPTLQGQQQAWSLAVVCKGPGKNQVPGTERIHLVCIPMRS